MGDEQGDGALGGGQSMGGADVTVEQGAFVGGVEVGRRLVQDHEQRARAHQTSGQGQPLPVVAGESAPTGETAADAGQQPLGERALQRVRVRACQRASDRHASAVDVTRRFVDLARC